MWSTPLWFRLTVNRNSTTVQQVLDRPAPVKFILEFMLLSSVLPVEEGGSTLRPNPVLVTYRMEPVGRMN